MVGDQSIGESNLLCAEALVRSFLSRGVDTFFVSPGYRDAPLIARLVAFESAKVYSAFDERSAAYQALGYAKASARPAVLVCTSGTAVANYLPAVIEASQMQVPMIIVSTDRPSRLRHTNANQVIDQTGILGKYVKRSIAISEAGPSFSAKAVASYVQKAIDWTAAWPFGVVHINLPFDEPLEPIDDQRFEAALAASGLEEYFKAGEFGHYRCKAPAIDASDIERLKGLCNDAKKPFLIVGSLTDDADQKRVQSLLSNITIPYFIDISSSLKDNYKGLSDLRDSAAKAWWDGYKPDLIIHLGGRLVTRSFEKAFSKKQDSPIKQVIISLEDQIVDVNHAGVWHLQSSPSSVCDAISAAFTGVGAPVDWCLDKAAAADNWSQQWQGVASSIWERLPSSFDLFLGNSTTIRLFDEALGQRQLQPTRRVFCNRGASGIEGLVSSGIGVEVGSGSPVCVVLGDISLMHDLNSLLSLKLTKARIVVIVLNDGNGGIFDQLPIGKHPHVCHPYISTPHEFSFAGVADMANLPYKKVKSAEELSNALDALHESDLPSLIELNPLL